MDGITELRKEFETLLTEACLAHYKAGENYAISSDVDYGKLCDIAKAKQRLVVAAALKRYEEIAESQQVMALMLAHKDAEIAQLKQAHADLFATSQEMNADLVEARAELESVKKDAKDGWDAFHKLRKQVAKGVYGDDLRNEVSAAYHADATGIT